MSKPSKIKKKKKNTTSIKRLKILNFIHLCLQLLKGYYNILYRKKKLENTNNNEYKK